MKSPKEPKPKVAVKKISKFIKGSGTSRNQQSYLSFANTNQQELPASKNTIQQELTYKNLLRMFETELLYNEANKLKSKAREIAEEIAKKIKGKEKIKENLSDYNIKKIQNIFNKTVENEIKKSESNLLKNTVDEELRKRLLNILYTAYFGYSKDSKPIVKDYKPILRGGGRGGLVNIEYWDQLWSPDLALNFQNEGFSMFELQQPIDLPVEASSSASPIYAQKEEESEEEESEEESYMRREILPKSYFIFPWKDFLLNVFKYLYYCFKRPPQQITYDSPETMKDKKDEIKSAFINSYQSGSEMQKIKEEFDRIEYQGNELIYKSIFNRLTIDTEIKEYRESRESKPKPRESARARSPTRTRDRRTLLNEFLNKYMPKYNGVFNFYKQTIYTPGGYDHITIQFDNTFDRKSILKNMLVLLYRFRNFTTFVNLLDCVPSDNIKLKPVFECNPYDMYAIYDMHVIANNMLKDAGVIDDRIRKFYTIKNLESMKAGDLETWYQINKIPEKSSKKVIGIFHSSQKDNAGIILLFLKLRDARTRTSGFLTKEFVRNGLDKKYFGLPNILDLINKFKDLFKEMHPLPKRRHRDYEPRPPYNHIDQMRRREHEELQRRENEFDREYYNEIFKTEKIWHIKLLRQRLNRIFYFLAKKHKIKDFYLYTCPPRSKYNDPFYDDEKATPEKIKELFSISFIVNIDWGRDFNDTDLNTHQRWVDGIRT